MGPLLRRLWHLFRQRQADDDLAEEMAFHRDMTARDLQARGLDTTEARFAAARAFGNTALAGEEARLVWIGPWLDSLRQDASYAARNLRRQPGFAAVVIAVLATVVGLHTALVTVLAGVVLRPWPGVTSPDRLVRLYLSEPNMPPTGLSMVDVRSLADRTRSLAGVAAMTGEEVRVGSGEAAQPVGALLVSGGFFELLGITMTSGRGFFADEDRAGAPRAVTVLGYDFWRSRFGGDATIVGRDVRINDLPFTVVGIASRDFSGAEPSYGKSLFVPIAAAALLRPGDASVSSLLYQPDYCCVDVVGRLAPNATRGQVCAELDLVSRTFASPKDAAARGAIVVGTEFFAQPGRGTQPLVAAALVSAGLLLVWLIACANIGNLLLARAAARVREIGIRLSLGASRPRLVRQLLTEGFVLALAASALGTGMAYELPLAILRFVGGASASFPFRVTPDAFVLGYSLLVAVASAVAFGLAPALHATRTDVARALTESGGLPAARFPLRSALLAVQVALSVILLVSAALLVRGARAQGGRFDPGFSVNDVSVVSFDLPPGAYDSARRRALLTELDGALRELPAGVIDAFGFATWEPAFIRRGYQALVRLPGDAVNRARPMLYLDVSPGYLGVLRIPIVAGRNFEPADTTRRVVVINEAMARQYWPDENPVGKSFFAGGPELREVVGVMRNTHTNDLGDVFPMFIQPLRESVLMPKLLVRGSGPAPAGEIARTVARLDPRVRVQTMPLSANLEARLQELRYGPMLAGVLGAFALALAAVGMFGVFAYAVRQRTREIGIRMALGAPPWSVVRLVLFGHARAVGAGLAAGSVGGVAASFILRSRLHGVGPFDPAAYLGVAGALAVAALAASYVPARRAARVDPVVALRCD